MLIVIYSHILQALNKANGGAVAEDDVIDKLELKQALKQALVRL